MKSQSGLTLVEMLITVAITGIIVVFLGVAIFQIIKVSAFGNDDLTALHEMQNVAYWFNFDGQAAKTATGGSQLTLTLTDNSTITYTKTGTNLQRIFNSQVMTLARNITAVNWAVSSKLVTMNLTSAPTGVSGVSENSTYMVYMRPAG